MSDLTSHTRSDLDFLPCDCELPAPLGAQAGVRAPTEAPCRGRTWGHLPRIIYTINSNRSRHQIIADYAATHDLTAKQVDELVRQLPDYGIKSMLHASLAVLRPTVVSLAAARAGRRGR